MRKRRKKIYDDDDGRVIAPMNVDGMPWNRDGAEPISKDKKDSTVKRENDDLMLTAGEKRAMVGGVFAAALLVSGIFVLAGFLFILFCVFVWFK